MKDLGTLKDHVAAVVREAVSAEASGRDWDFTGERNADIYECTPRVGDAHARRIPTGGQRLTLNLISDPYPPAILDRWCARAGEKQIDGGALWQVGVLVWSTEMDKAPKDHELLFAYRSKRSGDDGPAVDLAYGYATEWVFCHSPAFAWCEIQLPPALSSMVSA